MQVMARQRLGWVRGALTGIVLLALPGCVAQYRNHGYAPTPAELAEIKVGVDTRDSVVEAVGTPSSSGVLDESGYYYVSTRVRNFGLRKPQVVDRQLVAISFDARGVVANIERFGLEDGQVIPLERRVTDSAVSNKTFLRQLLGNIGNFSPDTFLSNQ